MNWDTVKGDWKQFRGKVREQWGKLTDDDLKVIEGNREQLREIIRKEVFVSNVRCEIPGKNMYTTSKHTKIYVKNNYEYHKVHSKELLLTVNYCIPFPLSIYSLCKMFIIL